MILIDMLDRSRTVKVPAGAARHSLIKEAAALFDAKCKPGIPYCQARLAFMLMQEGLASATDLERTMKLTRITIAVQTRAAGWLVNRHWPVYAPPPLGKLSTPQVLTYAVTPSVVQNATALSRLVEVLTGEEQTPSAMRRAVSRLVESGAYRRAGSGLYVNVYAGD